MKACIARHVLSSNPRLTTALASSASAFITKRHVQVLLSPSLSLPFPLAGSSVPLSLRSSPLLDISRWYLSCRAEISTRHEQTRVILRITSASSLFLSVSSQLSIFFFFFLIDYVDAFDKNFFLRRFHCVLDAKTTDYLSSRSNLKT